MSETPKGWRKAPLENLLEDLAVGKRLHQGWSPRCHREPSNNDGEWAVLKTTAIQKGQFLPGHNKRLPDSLKPRPNIEVKSGDILLTCAGPRARCGIPCLIRKTRPKLMMSGKMYRFRADRAQIETEYLEAFLLSKNAQDAIDRMKTGISESGLNLTHSRFKTLEVPVAPLQEQRRIVARIEELFSQLDAGFAALRQAKAQLKRYRQSVLTAAVTGQLTQAWREQHPDTEPAEELFQRILDQRRKSWSRKGNYKEPLSVDHRFTDPRSCWPLVNLDMIVEQPQYGTSKKCSYEAGGSSVLRIPNVINGVVDGADLKYAEFNASERLKFAIRENDLLMIRSNGSLSIVGKTALIREQDPQHLYAGYLIRIRPSTELVDAKFLSIALASRPLRAQIEQKAKSTSGVNNINAKEIQALSFHLPPLAEQHQIVAEVEARTTAIDHLEAELDRQITRSNRLRQSTLAAAFLGKL